MGPIHISRQGLGRGFPSASLEVAQQSSQRDLEANKSVTLCGQDIGPAWVGDDVVYAWNSPKMKEARELYEDKVCTSCLKVARERYDMKV